MSLHTSGPGEDLARWQLTASAGAPVHTHAMRPDATLFADRDHGAGAWKSSGEHAAFALLAGGVVLAAGWYRVELRVTSTEGMRMSPAFFAAYANGADGDAQIALPDPSKDGHVSALVLFKYDVTALRFCPAHGPSRFRLRDLSLHRLSRRQALTRMLVEGGGPMRAVGRVARYASGTARVGVSGATDVLYREYRRRTLPEDAGSYAGWVARFDTLDAARVETLQARVAALGDATPLISILVPTYQTPERWLRRCIDSVIAQAYPHWQLCIADDASPDTRVKAVLQEYADRDSRIDVAKRETNGHISAASNTALGLARGTFIALLDHDDELRPHALLEMAEAIAATPDVGLVYSDEDKIDADGRRFDPYFKPDFDADLLRSQNYVCHFSVIRADLVREVGGFREGFEGSQDHDLILRCTERLQPAQVHHVPKVLYHWRAIPGSTALSRTAKDYASSAGARAVGEHLDRTHAGARVEELSHGHYRVRWPLPDPAPKVSLVVPTRDRVELLRMCAESILDKTTYENFELVIVDNQSSDADALAYLRELESRDRVRVLRYDAPFNYSAINNWAVAQCDGAIVGLVNNDIEIITPDWLEELVSQALRPDVGAVGTMLYYPDDTIQHAGVALGVLGVAAHLYAHMPRGYPGHGGRARVAQSLSAVTGACLIVRRALYEELGGLDEALQVAFNDIDFCLRLREAGYHNVWTPFAEAYHHESASRGVEDTDEKKQRFAGEVQRMQNRWGATLLADPAYNPNLSLSSGVSDLAVPPRAPRVG